MCIFLTHIYLGNYICIYVSVCVNQQSFAYTNVNYCIHKECLRIRSYFPFWDVWYCTLSNNPYLIKATTLHFAHPTTICTANPCIKIIQQMAIPKGLVDPGRVSKIGRENKNEFGIQMTLLMLVTSISFGDEKTCLSDDNYLQRGD